MYLGTVFMVYGWWNASGTGVDSRVRKIEKCVLLG